MPIKIPTKKLLEGDFWDSQQHLRKVFTNVQYHPNNCAILYLSGSLVTPLLIVGCRFQLESSKVIDEKLGIVEVALSKMQHKKTRVEERCLWEMLMQVTSQKKTTLSIIHSLPHDYSRIDRGFPAPTVVVGWNDPGPLSWLSSLADLRVLGSRLGWHWLATPKDHHLYMCIYKYNVYINIMYIYIYIYIFFLHIDCIYIYMHYMHIKKKKNFMTQSHGYISGYLLPSQSFPVFLITWHL